MIQHGETQVITAQGRAEAAIRYYAYKARTHPLAARSRFRRRVWRDDRSLGDRIHAASAARRLSRVADDQLDQALADLRDGTTP